MVYSEFLKFIDSVRNNLAQNAYQNEAAVSTQIVLPVLQYLNWDINDPKHVLPEYPLRNLKVDYGLKVSENSKTPSCIIEVKTVGKRVTDEKLFEYAFYAGAPLAILTDGKQWRFYLPMSVGVYEERLVCTLDFERQTAGEVLKGLIRYLSFENTCSGQARKNAESDRDECLTVAEARKNISTTWQSLLEEPSDILVDLVIEETSSIFGSAPEKKDVEKFLKNLKNIKPEPEKPEQKTGREISFILLDSQYTEKTMTDAFVEIMKNLAERDKDFLPRLAPHLVGRKNRELSQNLVDLGEKKHVRLSARKLPGGWFLKTHSSTEGKIKILQKACEAARIPFGKPRGLKILS